MDLRQRAHVLRIGDGLADRDVGEPGDRDDVAGGGDLGGVPLESAGLQQLGDAGAADGAVVAHPCDRLALLQGAVEDAQQREAPEERARVEVGDPRLQGRIVVVGRSRNVLEDRLEQRLEVVVVGQRAVGGPIAGCRTGAAAGIDDRHVQQGVHVEVGHVVDQIACEPEQQVVGLLLDLGDAGVRAVGLVHQEDDGQLRLERLAQHEARLRQRSLARVHEEDDAVDHRQAALDLSAEVGVPGGVDDVDRDRAFGGVLALVRDRRVLGEDRDALLTLQIVRVHGALFHVLVRAEGAGLAQHRVNERRLAVVDVSDDRDVAEVRTEGARHEESLQRTGKRPEPGSPSLREAPGRCPGTSAGARRPTPVTRRRGGWRAPRGARAARPGRESARRR